jgi:hypothetical protein
MRTTIDLPDDLHRAALLLARDRRQTLSRTVASLLRSALAGEQGSPPTEIDRDSGLPTVRLGNPITAEDVAAAADDA